MSNNNAIFQNIYNQFKQQDDNEEDIFQKEKETLMHQTIGDNLNYKIKEKLSDDNKKNSKKKKSRRDKFGYGQNSSSNEENKNFNDYYGELNFGDEISILGTEFKLRENFMYNAYAKDNKYKLSEIQNFICLNYKFDNYEESC